MANVATYVVPEKNFSSVLRPALGQSKLAPSLRTLREPPAARVGYGGEVQRQRAYLVSRQHEFGDSRELKVIAVRMVQLRAGIAMQGAHKHALGRVNVGAVAFPGTPVALGSNSLP